MKKSEVKKIMAGVCTAAMLVSCSGIGVFASEIGLDPSDEKQQS